jgi:acetyl esterase/lipase
MFQYDKVMKSNQLLFVFFFIGLMLWGTVEVHCQQTVQQPLWPHGIKNNPVHYVSGETEQNLPVHAFSLSHRNRVFEKVTEPGYELYIPLPAKTTGVALVICPGGGFVQNCFDHEGTDLALWLRERGIASLVLKYRMNARDSKGELIIPGEILYSAALEDAKQAVRTLRSQAKQLMINPHKIGVVGFSAGGSLALSLATKPEEKDTGNAVSWKPDFAGLFYAATFKPEVISKETCPPIFMMNASDDNITPPAKCLELYAALLKAKVPCEIHIYNKGYHGFAMDYSKGESLKSWSDSFLAWLKDVEILGNQQ